MYKNKTLFDFSTEEATHNTVETIKYPNSHAQGFFTYEKKLIAKNGEVKKVNAFTVTAARISDLSLKYLQKGFAKEIDYQGIRAKIEKELHPFFEEHGLLEIKRRTTAQLQNQTRMINTKIEEEINKYIAKEMEDKRVVKIEFQEFLEKLSFISPSLFYRGGAPRFDRLMDVLEGIQRSSACEYHTKRVILEDDELKMIDVVGRSVMVPTIEYEIDEAMGVHSIRELKESGKKNKAKYIKNIVLRFSPETFSMLVSPGREFTSAPLEIREGFKTIYGFRLDMLVRSIEKIQHYDKVNMYPLEKLNKIFGVNYIRFNAFYKRVLEPALEDINSAKDIRVGIKKEMNGNKVAFIKFTIERDTELSNSSNVGYSDITMSYYIAVQHFFSNTYIENIKINVFEVYHRHIEEFLERTPNKSLSFGGVETKDKSIQEWEREYNQAIKDWDELLMLYTTNKAWFYKNDTYPSLERLTLVNKATGMPIEPIVGLLTLRTPTEALKYYKSCNNGNNENE